MTAGQRCMTRRNDGEEHDSSYAATGEYMPLTDRPRHYLGIAGSLQVATDARAP